MPGPAEVDPLKKIAPQCHLLLRPPLAVPTVISSSDTDQGAGGRKSPQMLSPQRGRSVWLSQKILSRRAGVELFEAGDEWCVRIVDGDEQVSSFVIESAMAFAEAAHPSRLGGIVRF